MFLSSLSAVQLADVLDIALVAVIVYAFLVWFKHAKAAIVVKGMLVLAAVYLFSRTAGLVMTTGIFHGFFAILLVALVVIFQEELRSVFERIAVWSLSTMSTPSASNRQSDVIVRSVADFAKEQVGALIVLRGKDPLERHIDAGWGLDGKVSEALLKSIFDPNSIGHDGAVIVENGKISTFGCRLPLSKDSRKTAQLGTRHTAALGLAELTDALCIVVSEERGTISVAKDGRIERLRGAAELDQRIGQFISEKQPRPQQDAVHAFLQRNSREKAIAGSAAILLWVLFVLGAKDWRQSYEVPVHLRNIPTDMRVAGIQPETVRVTFSGQMRDFYWVDRRLLGVRLDLSQYAKGTHYIRVSEGDVGRPAKFRLEEVDPNGVQVELMRKHKKPKLSQWR